MDRHRLQPGAIGQTAKCNRAWLANSALHMALTMITLSWSGSSAVGGITYDFELRESIPVPTGYARIGAVTDMDGDGVLDVAIGPSLNSQEDRWLILERNGGSWVQRYSYYNSSFRHWRVADIDGDGLPEIATGLLSNDTLLLHESTGDNSYQNIHSSTGHSNFIEWIGVGDSDGDSNLEFLISREGYSGSHVSILEATGNDSYTVDRDTVVGNGGNAEIAGAGRGPGTMDLDGDGLSDLVFSDDDRYTYGGGHVYVYENGTLVYDNDQFVAMSLGDTDRDGNMEMIGRPTIETEWNTVIYESVGDNAYSEVFSSLLSYGRVDLDGDRMVELYRTETGAGGARNQLRFYARDGNDLYDIGYTGSLLEGFSGDIGDILNISDTNGDGYNKLAVRQGNFIHILELRSSVPEPSALALLTALGLPVSLVVAWRRKSRRRRKGADTTSADS